MESLLTGGAALSTTSLTIFASQWRPLCLRGVGPRNYLG
ncbi:hypothetical protein JOE67_001680 [Microbacterium esteraromaticum]|nr:hypothetical protein [Microbacterium esteraromaticum]